MNLRFPAISLLIIGLLASCGPVSPIASTTQPVTFTLSPYPTWTPPPPLSSAELEKLFGDASCSWPCWQGITPGVTTRSEALDCLQNSSVVVKNSIKSEESKAGYGNAHWSWRINNTPSSKAGKMEWKDGVVSQILLDGFPKPSVPLETAINKYGPPEKVEVIDCTEVPEGEHRYWCGELFYAHGGFEIHLEWEDSWDKSDWQISPTDPIYYIVLFQPSTIEELVGSWGIHIQVDDLNLRDWKGYGNLYDLYVR